MPASHSMTASGSIAQRGKGCLKCLMLMLCCGLVTQCALRPIPRDLAVYFNRDVSGIIELEDLALQRYAALTGDNYISDEALRTSLVQDIIPAYTRFADLIFQIKPQAEQVDELHAYYRRAASFRLQGFRTVLLAIDNQDPAMIHQANRILEQGQQNILLWQMEMARMSREYGLNLN